LDEYSSSGREQAEKEKRRKHEEEKNNQKILRAEQEIQEGLKREQARQESARKAREEARILFESQREQRALEEILDPFHENPLAIVIYNEYMAISRIENHKMAFRKLSMKYHPDKNPTKNTTLHQQIIHHIHDKFVKK
jgi:curved DNA-binding protein CbpA